jgi:hypothetical protein
MTKVLKFEKELTTDKFNDICDKYLIYKELCESTAKYDMRDYIKIALLPSNELSTLSDNVKKRDELKIDLCEFMNKMGEIIHEFFCHAKKVLEQRGIWVFRGEIVGFNHKEGTITIYQSYSNKMPVGSDDIKENYFDVPFEKLMNIMKFDDYLCAYEEFLKYKRKKQQKTNKQKIEEYKEQIKKLRKKIIKLKNNGD